MILREYETKYTITRTLAGRAQRPGNAAGKLRCRMCGAREQDGGRFAPAPCGKNTRVCLSCGHRFYRQQHKPWTPGSRTKTYRRRATKKFRKKHYQWRAVFCFLIVFALTGAAGLLTFGSLPITRETPAAKVVQAC